MRAPQPLLHPVAQVKLNEAFERQLRQYERQLQRKRSASAAAGGGTDVGAAATAAPAKRRRMMGPSAPPAPQQPAAQDGAEEARPTATATPPAADDAGSSGPAERPSPPSAVSEGGAGTMGPQRPAPPCAVAPVPCRYTAAEAGGALEAEGAGVVGEAGDGEQIGPALPPHLRGDGSGSAT